MQSQPEVVAHFNTRGTRSEGRKRLTNAQRTAGIDPLLPHATGRFPDTSPSSPTGKSDSRRSKRVCVQAFVHEIDVIARWQRRTSFCAFGF